MAKGHDIASSRAAYETQRIVGFLHCQFKGAFLMGFREKTKDNRACQRKLWLIYFPRAAHHLFLRMFSEQPNLSQVEVLTHLVATTKPTIQLSNRPALQDVKDDCETLRALQRLGWQKWLENIDALEQRGHRVISSHSVAFHISPAIHNALIHANQVRVSTSNNKDDTNSLSYWRLPSVETEETDRDSNPTIFPTSFLRSHVPILLIRHPALAFPSTLRVATRFFGLLVGEAFGNLTLRYRWHRMLYDWYDLDSRHPGGSPQPLVVDADDLMYNRATLDALCARVDLDPRFVKYSWDSMSQKEMQTQYEGETLFLDTLLRSNGILQGKGSNTVELESETLKWKEEFGVEKGIKLRRMVDAAMEDYEFLKARRLRGSE